MSESVRKHRKWWECAAKWRNRRGNILILCLEVVQGGPTNWNERNMRIGRGAAYQRCYGYCLRVAKSGRMGGYGSRAIAGLSTANTVGISPEIA
jgi:hypothetical protein